MYLGIEEEFRYRSKLRQSQGEFLGGVIIFILFMIFLFSRMVIEQNFWLYYSLFFVEIVIFLIGYYLSIWLKSAKAQGIGFFKFDEVVSCYRRNIHNLDMELLREILKRNHINTRPKIQEAIRHYQCLLPRKVNAGGQFFTILALTISIIALFFSAPFYDSVENMISVIIILITVIMFYFVIRALAKEILKIWGEDAFYSRMEESLSEIFMTYYNKSEGGDFTTIDTNEVQDCIVE